MVMTSGFAVSAYCQDPKEKVFQTVKKSPQFSDGTAAMMKFIDENIQYPEDPAEVYIEGQVAFKFVVEKDGSISNPTIVRGRTESLNNEAIRIVSSMPKWIPGELGGKAVRSYYTTNINFKLPE